MERAPTDHEALWICGTCTGLYGRSRGIDPGHDNGDQRCSCRREPVEPTWAGFDFNEYVHLCECCLQEVLLSGSRFSVWFCSECRERVVVLNDELRYWLIPIGRHSFQARTYEPPGWLALPGTVASADGPAARAAIEGFTRATVGLFSSMQRLHLWSEASLAENLRDLGFAPSTSVALPEYLRSIRAEDRSHGRFSKEAAFERLTDHMLGSRASVPTE